MSSQIEADRRNEINHEISPVDNVLYSDAISPEQLDKLYDLYAKDFKNGWCKTEDIITV